MSAMITETTFDSFAAAAAAVTKHRGVAREDMPLYDPSAGPGAGGDDASSFEIADNSIRVIVAADALGSDAANAIVEKVMASPAVAAETAEADVEPAAEEPANDAAEIDGRDVIVWARQSGEPHFEVRAVSNDRIAVVLCADEIQESMVAELAASMVRAIVAPYTATHDSRAAWKIARAPRIEVTSELEPASGDFDIPIGRRIDTLLAGANKRVDAMYQTVFSRKLIAMARAAGLRWAKKAQVAVAKPVDDKGAADADDGASAGASASANAKTKPKAKAEKPAKSDSKSKASAT